MRTKLEVFIQHTGSLKPQPYMQDACVGRRTRKGLQVVVVVVVLLLLLLLLPPPPPPPPLLLLL